MVGICQSFRLNQEQNIWDVIYTLLVETIPTNFYWLPAENKNFPKVSTVAKTICSDIRILTVLTDFCPLINVHFNDMQINRWLYLSGSPWGIPIHCNLFWKRRDPKSFLFIGTINWIALAVWWSIKHFLLQICQYFG